MSRRWIAPLIAGFAFAMLLLGWRIYAPIEAARYHQTQQVRTARSVIKMSYAIVRDKGPIAREEFTYVNDNGDSRVTYAGTNRAGTLVARFDSHIAGYDVTFLFDKVVADGIWELTSMPPRGDTTVHYEISIYQLANGQDGSHRFTFTDPHYWATTGGRQYKIKLSRDKPVPDLLTMKSTALAEPRYGSLINDFEAFGPPAFRSTLAKARAKLQSSA